MSRDTRFGGGPGNSLSGRLLLVALLLLASSGLAAELVRIEARAGPGGTIQPDGAVDVVSGSQTIFFVRPEAGFEIEDVKVDGVSRGRRGTLPFRRVTKPHSIHATFRPSGLVNFYGRNVHVLKLFGQFAVGESSENTVVPNRIFHASGVAVDRTGKPNKIYVVDSGNNRILGFNGLGHCESDPSSPCTTDGDCPRSRCLNDPDRPADLIFGQPDSRTASCNGDNNLGIERSPTSTSLCLLGFPRVTNTGEYWMRANFDVDRHGNLHVVDTWNNRVLRYNRPFSIDRADGKGDTIADGVLGQDDFCHNEPNRGQGTKARDNRSLNFTVGGFDHVASRGVSVDGEDNVWVADTFNYRVLRFPPGSSEADLVLGQSSFTASDSSNCEKFSADPARAPLDRMCTPTLARVEPRTGDLYVIDEYPGGFKARILVFSPPFKSGMAARRTLAPLQDRPIEGHDGIFRTSGFVFNPYRKGRYATGVLWVCQDIGGLNRVVLLEEDGKILEVIGAVDAYHLGGDSGLYGRCGQTVEKDFNLVWPGGNIGFDSANNVYLGDEHFHRVARFSLPYEHRQVGAERCLPQANGGLFNTSRANAVSGYKFSGAVGAFAHRDQLVVKDAGRYLVWDRYLDKGSNSRADFVIGQPSDDATTGVPGNSLGARGTHAIDDQDRMWTFNGHGKIVVYQLPFRPGFHAPLADFVRLYWADDGAEVDYGGFEVGLAFDRVQKKIWAIDRSHHRLLRIANHADPTGKLLVDMVIGQPDKSSVACNRSEQAPSARSLCTVTQIEFDRRGNLFVVENAYECHPNDRITVYLAEDMAKARGLFPELEARKVFVASSFDVTGGCRPHDKLDEPFSPVSIAFDSKNQMVVGNDGYHGIGERRHLRQLWLYRDPLERDATGGFVQGQKPDACIELPLGAAGDLDFDVHDNLIVQDHTWCRVWVINLNADPAWLVPTPVTPVTR